MAGWKGGNNVNESRNGTEKDLKGRVDGECCTARRGITTVSFS